MSLPELPDPFALSVSVHEGDTPGKTYAECMLYQAHPNEKQRLYTADQMRAYALQAVEALRQQSVGETFDQWLKRVQPAGAVSDMERGWNACAESLRREPMMDEQRSLIIGRAADKTVDRSAAALYAICETERLYHITQKEQG